MRLALGLGLTRRRGGAGGGPYITLAEGGVAPAIAAVTVGDTIADAFPATSYDTANFQVVGDETDSIVGAVREWNLNGAGWESEDSPYTQGPVGTAFLTDTDSAYQRDTDGAYLVEGA